MSATSGPCGRTVCFCYDEPWKCWQPGGHSSGLGLQPASTEAYPLLSAASPFSAEHVIWNETLRKSGILQRCTGPLKLSPKKSVLKKHSLTPLTGTGRRDGSHKTGQWVCACCSPASSSELTPGAGGTMAASEWKLRALWGASLSQKKVKPVPQLLV